MHHHPAPLAYSIPGAVQASHISRSGLYEAMKSGELPYKKRGRRTFILASDLKRFLEAQPSGKSN